MDLTLYLKGCSLEWWYHELGGFMHIQRDGKRSGCFYLASNMCLLDFSDLDVVLRSNNFKLFIF